MGQRSQIYIRIKDTYNEHPKLFAKYYQWNYGERMISRARHGIEYIIDNQKYVSQGSVQERINRIFDVNFDMKDIAITSDLIKEWVEDFADSYSPNDYIFRYADNNDGKLFIDIDENNGIKYCFTDYDFNILSPSKYMDWNFEDWKESKYLEQEVIDTCKENIKFINQNAKLMTKEELIEFIEYDYSIQINKLAEKLGIELKEKQKEQNQDEIDICE